MNSKKKIVLCLMVCAAMFTTTLAGVMPVVASVTITVPDDYPTIRQGVNAAGPGDTILVRARTYFEHVSS